MTDVVRWIDGLQGQAAKILPPEIYAYFRRRAGDVPGGDATRGGVTSCVVVPGGVTSCMVVPGGVTRGGVTLCAVAPCALVLGAES